MNYYMPYFNMYPNMVSTIATAGASRGIFSKLLGGGLNWGSILTNTQKTLGLVNQAIPVIKQVTPVMKNAKTIFKVMNEFKKVDTPSVNNTTTETTPTTNINNSDNTNDTYIDNQGGPTFFVN